MIIHACELRKKKSYFASFGPKTYSSLFLLSFFDLGQQNPSSLKVKRPGSESTTLQIQPQQLARFELRSQQNTFTDVTHGNNRFDVICLATGDTKHLYPAYSGCIRFKSLRPRALRALRRRNLNRIYTSLVDVI